MPIAYFLGAGASAADGLPTTDELNYGIAAFLRTSRGRDSSLTRYYRDLYGVQVDELRKAADAWEAFIDNRSRRPIAKDPLPNLIEALSVLDLNLQDGMSLGAPSTRTSKHPELSASVLAMVRLELSMALGSTIKDAMFHQQASSTNSLVARLHTTDAIITTNWDTLVDRAVTTTHRKRQGTRWLRSSNIRYGCVNERLVNWRGSDLPLRTTRPVTLLKLHGSLNWFFCPCCGELFANVEGPWIIDPVARRRGYDECYCGAGLENLIVAPSFVKNYGNVHIRSTWQNARARSSPRHYRAFCSTSSRETPKTPAVM